MQLIPHGLGSLIRFLIGIVLLQAVTLLLGYTAMHTDIRLTWPLFVLLGLSIGVLAAFWFNSIVAADRHRTLSRASERFLREREKIRLKAEQLRSKAKRSSMGVSAKTGVVVGGAIGVGIAMMFAQFMTLGLLTLSAAGGVALGYGVRVRQEKGIMNKRLEADARMMEVIALDDTQKTSLLPQRKPKRNATET